MNATWPAPRSTRSANDGPAGVSRVQLGDLAGRLRDRGLDLLGGFHPGSDDDTVPALADGRPTGTVLLVGSHGDNLWRHFEPWWREHPGPDPLDRWTEAMLRPLADALGAGLSLPFQGPPWLPFQRWARRAAPCWPSPLGILVHARHGLWFGLRGALHVADRLSLERLVTAPDAARSPCLDCPDRPCLDACPVAAFDGREYHVSACAQHLNGAAGVNCNSAGCLARRACPLAAGRHYPPAQMRFHMQAFVAAHGGPAPGDQSS